MHFQFVQIPEIRVKQALSSRKLGETARHELLSVEGRKTGNGKGHLDTN